MSDYQGACGFDVHKGTITRRARSRQAARCCTMDPPTLPKLGRCVHR